MPRWSRRWAAGEATKDQLREILEQAAAAKAQRGSIEQLTGDFYAGCMNEAQANSLGAKPIAPLLAQIDAIRRTRRPAEDDRRAARHRASPRRSSCIGDSDVAQSVVRDRAVLHQRRSGMPDRDYYLKDDARFKEAREKYLAYMQRLFTLAGSNEAQAKAAAETVMRMETRLRRSVARQRRAARSASRPITR